MLDKLRKIVAELLASSDIDGVIALKHLHGNVQPYVYKKGDDLDSLVISPKYPVATICKTIQSKYPDTKLGVVVRGCDERALIELAKRNQVNFDNLTLVGIACTADQANECVCDIPYPTKIDAGEKVDGVSTSEEIENIISKDIDSRLNYWKDEFSKCIKCYGCRNICPLCVCENCVLEDDSWVKVGEIPPAFPSFHLIRAFHLSDMCISCGECQKACPMDIPLLSLYAMIRKEFNQLFDYVPGKSIERKSPLVTSLEQEPIREGSV